MENRKSLILHFDSLDVLDELSDEQIGKLFKAIRDYNLGKEVKLDGLMKAIFIPFKNQFDRDLEKYKKKCEINAENGKKGGRPKETQDNPENPVGYFETQDNQEKPYNKNDSKNDNDSDNKKDNDNVNNNIILSKDNEETSLVKIDNRRDDINIMQELIKQKVLSLGLIYKSGTQERNRITNILTGKDFGNICELSKMSREQFVINIIELSTKLEFWKGKIYNAETLYKHYASVYNEAVRIKSEIKKPGSVRI